MEWHDIIIYFFLLIFKFCLGKQSELESMVERDEEMRAKYHDPIEQFPDKIDQLFHALDRVWITVSSFSVFYDFIYFFCTDLHGSAKVFIARKVKN